MRVRDVCTPRKENVSEKCACDSVCVHFSAHASDHFQPADCLRPEDNLQPLVARIVILPSRLPQHFDGLRSRQEFLSLFSAPRSLFPLFHFFEKLYLPGCLSRISPASILFCHFGSLTEAYDVLSRVFASDLSITQKNRVSSDLLRKDRHTYLQTFSVIV